MSSSPPRRGACRSSCFLRCKEIKISSLASLKFSLHSDNWSPLLKRPNGAATASAEIRREARGGELEVVSARWEDRLLQRPGRRRGGQRRRGSIRLRLLRSVLPALDSLCACRFAWVRSLPRWFLFLRIRVILLEILLIRLFFVAFEFRL